MFYSTRGWQQLTVMYPLLSSDVFKWLKLKRKKKHTAASVLSNKTLHQKIMRSLINEDHTDKIETTNLIEALDKYTHKKHPLVTGLPNHQSTQTFTTSLPNMVFKEP